MVTWLTQATNLTRLQLKLTTTLQLKREVNKLRGSKQSLHNNNNYYYRAQHDPGQLQQLTMQNCLVVQSANKRSESRTQLNSNERFDLILLTSAMGIHPASDTKCNWSPTTTTKIQFSNVFIATLCKLLYSAKSPHQKLPATTRKSLLYLVLLVLLR